MEDINKLDTWALVELFGHTKIVGKLSERNIAGSNMLQIDVPETKSSPAYTKFYGNAAIYAITPIDESLAKQLAENFRVKPINIFDIKNFMDKIKSLPENSQDDDDNYDDYGEF